MKNKFVVIVDHQAMSKPADLVIKHARRHGIVIDEYDWHFDIEDIPFFKAFTKTEIRDYLREFVFHTNDAYGERIVRLKDCKIVKGKLTDCDSTNLSHACAYYAVWIKLPLAAVVGTPLTELIDEKS